MIKRILTLTGIGIAVATAQAPKATPAKAAPAAITIHTPDAFYDPPKILPKKPAALLRSETLKDVKLPNGMRGWRILYTTTIDDETRATAVAIVLAPVNAPAGPRPVIAWAHGATGLLQKCMPSLMSTLPADVPALDKIAAAGWVIVATDYSFAEKGGPHPLGIGEGEARSTLDGARAARQMPELNLDERTAVWGVSQGGHAALWAGIIGPRYAPDIKIVGVAAIAPAADVIKISELNASVDKRLGAYVALSYSRFYPDVKFDQAIRPAALSAAREMVNLCNALPPEDSQRIVALMETFEGPVLANTNKALLDRLVQNTPHQAIVSPLVIAQGLADSLVLPAATDSYVDQRCEAGQRLEYWKFAGQRHAGIVQPGSPLETPLIAWTMARFANEPQASGCTRQSF